TLVASERRARGQLLLGLGRWREILRARDDGHATARAHRVAATRSRKRHARTHGRAQKTAAATHAVFHTQWNERHLRQSCGTSLSRDIVPPCAFSKQPLARLPCASRYPRGRRDSKLRARRDTKSASRPALHFPSATSEIPPIPATISSP